jgi:aminoglycoside 2''-phosphotransferase
MSSTISRPWRTDNSLDDGRVNLLFPYVFAGYPKLNGTPAIDLSVDLADAIALAPSLGSFLSALHSFSPLDAHDLGVPQAEMDPRVGAKVARDELKALASVLEAEHINRCRFYLEDQIRANLRYSGPPRLLHADFSAEHILLSSDGRQVVGVIDWTDAEIGDPAFDFGYLWVWQGEPLVTEVIRHYRGVMDPGFFDRVRLYGVCSAIADAYYGVTAGIDKNRQIGVAALERSFLRNS